jgi:hypothetical protein
MINFEINLQFLPGLVWTTILLFMFFHSTKDDRLEPYVSATFSGERRCQELFARAGLDPRSYLSEPSKQVGLQT